MKALHPSDRWTGPIPLTRRQLELLQILHELILVQRLVPTYDDLAIELELAGKSSVCRLVYQLVEKGWVTLEPCRGHIQVLHPPTIIPDFGLELVLSADPVPAAALEMLP